MEALANIKVVIILQYIKVSRQQNTKQNNIDFINENEKRI